MTCNRWVKVLQEAGGQAGRQSDLTAIGKLSDDLNTCMRLYRKDNTKAVETIQKTSKRSSATTTDNRTRTRQASRKTT